MVPLRRLLFVLGLFCLVTLNLGVGSAAAARPSGYPDTVSSDHFVVHFTGDLLATDRITAQTAADVAQIAERAYSTLITSYGYPAPLDDGDGKIDIYVLTPGNPALLGLAIPEGSGNQLPGYIELSVGGGLTSHVIAHELFHLIQFGIFIPNDGWLMESTAEWMGFRFDGFPLGIDASLGAPDMSLDCIGDKCGSDDYEISGYSRWSFFEYLSERFGGTIVKDVFTDGATLGDPAIPGIQLVADAIAAKGSSLQNVFIDWTVANLNGNYTALGLKGVLPLPLSETMTGTLTGSLPVQRVAVNHLAARYLSFKRGDGSGAGPCYAATLSLAVTYPAALAAKPYFYWSAGGTPTALSGSAGSASISVPWDTCSWNDAGYLLLQNPSTTLDAQIFTVTPSITVDKTTPAVSADPPKPVSVIGVPVPAPTSDVPPTLTVHAPELLRVSAKTRVLRLIVYSTGDGKLRATLGSLDLGSSSLRAGNNDVRYVLPASLVKSLRRTSSNNVLSLTSLSPQGAEGSTVTRRVTIIKPPAKKKVKHH
jgi:Family of unknown function (DUF6055)